MEAYNQQIKELVNQYQTNLKMGLASNEANRRIQKYGKNKVSSVHKESLIFLIWDALLDPPAMVLTIASIASVAIGELMEGIFLFIFLMLAILIKCFQRVSWEKSFEENYLRSEHQMVHVMRDGALQSIYEEDLTLGDILFIEKGDKIFADGRVIRAENLFVDEKYITDLDGLSMKSPETLVGDSLSLNERKNMVYANSMVLSGRGIVLVTAVAKEVQFVKLKKDKVDAFAAQSPFQKKLQHMVRQATTMSIIMSVSIFLSTIYTIFKGNGIVSSMELFYQIKNAMVWSVVLLLAVGPEYFYLKYVALIAVQLKEFYRKKVLVKDTKAFEYLLDINRILTHKTGILTEKTKSVTDIWNDGRFVPLDEIETVELLENFCINSGATSHGGGDIEEYFGDDIECALLQLAKKNQIGYEELRNLYPKVMAEFVYTEEIRLMTTAIEHNVGYRIYTKGEWDNIFSVCTKILYQGRFIAFSEELKWVLQQKIQEMEKQGKSTMAFAYKDENQYQLWQHRSELEKNMIFLGFVAMESPIRVDVFDPVQKLLKMGIEIKLISKDNVQATENIAKKLGILRENEFAMSARNPGGLDESTFKVIAQAGDQTKGKIAKLEAQKGASVLLVGTSPEDAAAMKEAKIGVAMQRNGSQATKDRADLLLMDDSFASIVTSILWNRGAFLNFKKAVQFHWVYLLSLLVIVFILEVFSPEMRMGTFQLLWLSIFMFSPLHFVLLKGSNREKDLLQLSDEKALPSSKELLSDAGVQTLVIVLATLYPVLFMGGEGVVEILLYPIQASIGFLFPMGTGAVMKQTILFNLFVFLILWSLVNNSQLANKSAMRGVFLNQRLWWAILPVAFVIQYAVSEWGGFFLGTVPLPWEIWVKILFYSACSVILYEMYKFLRFFLKLCTKVFK